MFRLPPSQFLSSNNAPPPAAAHSFPLKIIKKKIGLGGIMLLQQLHIASYLNVSHK